MAAPRFFICDSCRAHFPVFRVIDHQHIILPIHGLGVHHPVLDVLQGLLVQRNGLVDFLLRPDEFLAAVHRAPFPQHTLQLDFSLSSHALYSS